MAIQFTDFSKAPLNTQESPLTSIFDNVLKGYKMSQEPGKMKQEASARELANQLKKLEVDHKPKEYDLDDKSKEYANALKSKALEHFEEKFNLDKDYKQAQIDNFKSGGGKSGLKLTGDIANYKLIHPDATDEEVRNFADRLFESKIKHTDAGTERSLKLNETQDARSQTSHGKLLQEARDVQDGFFPGTGRSQKFDTPERQKFYKDQYDLKLLKERSDSVTRNRAIYAGLVDNTFDNINVDKLVQYGGVSGEIDKRLAQGQMVPEKEQEKYKEYKAEVAKVQVLAKQIRQFYGDSISPSNLQKLEDISNPAKWSESPAAAKAQFESFKKIVKQETGIYRGALSSLNPFMGAKPEESSPQAGAKVYVYNPKTGRLE